MDDFVMKNLNESKYEWCNRLLHILTPSVIQGIKSIFEEAWKLCQEKKEINKYLMTFQVFLARVPQWNETIISNERKRIIEKTGCNYLEDLITSVHVLQLKVLSCVRVGQKQKKIDINVPSLDQFIHSVYINVARKSYVMTYLFERNIDTLKIQENNFKLEQMVRDCIMDTVRENVPVESILRAYMDETDEMDVEVKEDVVVEKLPVPTPTPPPPEKEVSTPPKEDEPVTTPVIDVVTEQDTVAQDTVATATANAVATTTTPAISFSDFDNTITVDGTKDDVLAPKTPERLESISMAAEEKRKAESKMDDEDNDDRLKIGDLIDLDMGIKNLDKPISLNDAPLLDGVEVLF
jgi:hypothetical protein